MQIGELARITGISCDALRLYEQRGMIQSARRPNGYRDFHEGTVALVEIIKLAQSIGFRLSEIAPEMQAVAKYGMGSDEVAHLLRNKLAEVDARIIDLSKKRDSLAGMLDKVCPLKASDSF